MPDAGSASSGTGSSREEKLRTVRTRRDKVLRFDGEAPDGGSITWFVAYNGKFGWAACRGTGEWIDDPSAEDVEDSFDEYDHSRVVDRSEVPEEVTL